MTSVVQYVKIMRDAQYDMGIKLGVDFSGSSMELRALLLSNLAVQAVVVKALVDKGVISNQELLLALNAARSSTYNPSFEPSSPVTWDTTPVTGV